MQLYKVLMGASFPGILSKALRLNIVYYHGGLLLPSEAKLIKDIPDSYISNSSPYWFAESPKSNDFCLFAAVEDEHVLSIMEDFMNAIEANCLEVEESTTSVEKHDDTSCSSFDTWKLSQSEKSKFKYSDYFVQIGHKTPESSKHYGVLTYDTRVRFNQPGGPKLVANVGDEIQSLASVSWLPYIDIHVERDNVTHPFLEKFPNKSIKTFLNGWYGSKIMTWPPSNAIDPVLLAVHIEPSVNSKFSSRKSTKFLANTLVGARDTSTKEFLKSNGIHAFFSGCMTLTTYPIRPGKSDGSNCEYLFVDISDTAYEQLPEDVKQDPACRISHRMEGNAETIFNSNVRFTAAFKLLERYSSAKVVVTSRLHSALPASSMGVTVIMIQSKTLPGGGSGKDNNRFSGLSDIFLAVPEESIQTELQKFDWTNPPSNPGAALIQDFRCKILNYLKVHHNDLIDVIQLFDLHRVFDSCE